MWPLIYSIMGLWLHLSWSAYRMIINVMNVVSIVEIPGIKAVWTMACVVARPFSTSYITPITKIDIYESSIRFHGLYEMYLILLKCNASMILDAKNKTSHSRFIYFYSMSIFAIKMGIRLESWMIMTMLNHKRVN